MADMILDWLACHHACGMRTEFLEFWFRSLFGQCRRRSADIVSSSRHENAEYGLHFQVQYITGIPARWSISMILEVTAKPDTYVICRFVFQEFNPNQLLSIPSVLNLTLRTVIWQMANLKTLAILRRFSVSFAAGVAFFAVVLAN